MKFMGTTINGVYQGGKRERRKSALKRLEIQLPNEIKRFDEVLNKPKDQTPEYLARIGTNIDRINKEIEILKSKL